MRFTNQQLGGPMGRDAGDFWTVSACWLRLVVWMSCSIATMVRLFRESSYTVIYIYIYTCYPPKTYQFCIFTGIYSVFCLFCCQKRHYILKCFSIFGHLNLMMFEMICVDTRACFAAICSVFEHSIVVLADVYSWVISKMDTALWWNANCQVYICFYSVFVRFGYIWDSGISRPFNLVSMSCWWGMKWYLYKPC